MFCPNCGKEQMEGSKFCRSCGMRLVQEPAVQPGIQPGIQPGVQPFVQPGVPYERAMEYAGFWRRFGAYIIDYILLGVIGFVLSLVIGFLLGAAGADEAIITALAYIIISVLYWLYFALSESSSKQATPGKQALRIIVTDDVGRRISFGRATGRLFSKIISGIILYIGFFMIAWTRKKQGLHDMMAGTLVILK